MKVFRTESQNTESRKSDSKFARPTKVPSRPMVASVNPSHAPRPSGYVRNTRSSAAAGSMKIAPSTFRLFCTRDRKARPEVMWGSGRRAGGPRAGVLRSDLVVALRALLGPLGCRLGRLRARRGLRDHVDQDGVRHRRGRRRAELVRIPVVE